MRGPPNLRRLVARHSTSTPVELLRRAAYRVVDVLQTEDHDLHRNGELKVLGACGASARVIFDIGANQGDWTAAALKKCPNATVYAFDISGASRSELRSRFGAERRVVVADRGVLDRPGTVRVKTYPDHCEWNSVVDYPHDAESVWVEEPVMRGDDYVEEHGISEIHLLKVDAEGADLNVLRSFQRTLAKGRISVVQFEYGYASILSGGSLYGFHRLLEPLGYQIARLRKRGLDPRPYRLTQERFFGPNYVAVHESARYVMGALI